MNEMRVTKGMIHLYSQSDTKGFYVQAYSQVSAGLALSLARRALMQEPLHIDFYPDNPLVLDILRVLVRLQAFKEQAREFYFEVVLSGYACPECCGNLRMVGDSRCACDSGHEFDPTIAFQQSECCGVRLARRVLHYECTACKDPVRSRFLFDERVFDKDYFREMMRESRERSRQKREAIRLLLLSSRSGPLIVADLPGLDEVPGLVDALDAVVGVEQSIAAQHYKHDAVFDMETYRRMILESVGDWRIWFDAFPRICEDPRRDRVRRFVTLVYLEHEGQVDLTQVDDRIVVSRHEVNVEG